MKVGDTVYARRLLGHHTGQKIPTNARGVIVDARFKTTRRARRTWSGPIVTTYEGRALVRWGPDFEGWYDVSELTKEPVE